LRTDDPTNLMLINGLLVLHHPPDFERVREVIRERLVPIPRFRQRVAVSRRGRPRWEADPDFDLDRHVSRLALPPPGGDPALKEVIERLITIPLDRSLPLWHFYLL